MRVPPDTASGWLPEPSQWAGARHLTLGSSELGEAGEGVAAGAGVACVAPTGWLESYAVLGPIESERVHLQARNVPATSFPSLRGSFMILLTTMVDIKKSKILYFSI
jgi:hypothetical protein